MKARVVSSADIGRCPKRSLLPSHYRDDGSCRCDEDGARRTTIPAVGTTVRFMEGTPQSAKCAGIDYLVELSPRGRGYSTDDLGQPYVWLVMAADMDRPPSRRRRRTAWAWQLIAGTP